MKNSPGKRWHGSSVAIHGPLLRHIRQLRGLTTAQLAEQAAISPDYLRKVELGFNRGVAPDVYTQLNQVLNITDRRVLLVDPLTTLEEIGNHEEQHANPIVVHGPALARIRDLTGLSADRLADECGVTADYLESVELGFTRALPVALYDRLIFALRIDDPRVLMADPWLRPDEDVSAEPAPEMAS